MLKSKADYFHGGEHSAQQGSTDKSHCTLNAENFWLMRGRYKLYTTETLNCGKCQVSETLFRKLQYLLFLLQWWPKECTWKYNHYFPGINVQRLTLCFQIQRFCTFSSFLSDISKARPHYGLWNSFIKCNQWVFCPNPRILQKKTGSSTCSCTCGISNIGSS